VGKDSVSVQEREVERIFSSLGGLMGRVRKEGDPISFDGHAVLFSAHGSEKIKELSASNRFSGVFAIMRKNMGNNRSSLSVSSRNYHAQFIVDNSSWTLVPEDRTNSTPYQNHPYLRANLSDPKYLDGSELRFYAK